MYISMMYNRMVEWAYWRYIAKQSNAYQWLSWTGKNMHQTMHNQVAKCAYSWHLNQLPSAPLAISTVLAKVASRFDSARMSQERGD